MPSHCFVSWHGWLSHWLPFRKPKHSYIVILSFGLSKIYSHFEFRRDTSTTWLRLVLLVSFSFRLQYYILSPQCCSVQCWTISGISLDLFVVCQMIQRRAQLFPLPRFFQLALLLRLPESPRWLYKKGEINDAVEL